MTTKANDCVLDCTLSSGKVIKVTPITFSHINFSGAKVKGNPYYVKKAVSLGATKVTTKKPKDTN